jgi:ParB family chromosome partitioning protein
MAKKQVLGKGIHALIAEFGDSDVESRQIVQLPVEEIEPNPYQPRSNFDAEKLDQLTRSILEKGVIQPVSVNRVGTSYHLIAGERRWRATRMAGFDSIPAIVHEIDSVEELLELALIENIQRDDLDPIEEAEGYRRLIDTCLLTQEQIGEKVGRDRSTIANSLRLLKLPVEVQNRLRSGELQMGHARALITLEHDDCLELGQRAAQGKLSVRELEQAVRDHTSGRSGKNRDRRKTGGDDSRSRPDPVIESWKEKLRHHFGTAVEIHRVARKGRVEIEFYDDDDLERILELLLGE